MKAGGLGEPSRALTEWFAANRRELPWRVDAAGSGSVTEGTQGVVREGPSMGNPESADPAPRRDPYGTWISEIMLQQTQVATVMDYYRRWMARFPDVASLARAEESEVLEAWAGLGYYSRARNVLATARQVMADFGGRFPSGRDELLGLKGIGEYTAGAIASLAFNRPEPILDGNIVRVFSRLEGLDFLPDTKEGKRTYWDLARSWAESRDPALVNEGLMELGALVCTPRNPDCARCPLTRFCRAYAMGDQDRFPPARSRKDAVEVAGYAVAAFTGALEDRKVLLYTPKKPERLAGLLTFPVFAVSDLRSLREAWKSALPALAGAAIRPRTGMVTHSITHHRYRLRLVEAIIEEGCLPEDGPMPEGYAWEPAGDLDRILVSSLPRKIWKALAGQ
ncbi:MAG: A/G-specific adenine glycosylase [Fibrobacteres bacterium]|nr:A/G-specific adenine glycosylase [Fibrobacterota bacterium]